MTNGEIESGIYKKARLLKIGDTIVTMSGYSVKLTKISKGFYPNSLILDWGVGCDWACIDEEAKVKIK